MTDRVIIDNFFAIVVSAFFIGCIFTAACSWVAITLAKPDCQKAGE
jgi:hypothetical protein